MDLSAPINGMSQTNIANSETARTVLYLHGFASGPGSTKAKFFKQAFEQAGIETIVPDLNVPSFEKMTLRTQLDLLAQVIGTIPTDKSLTLMGSSMGGLLAALAGKNFASTNRIQSLILLAPGFGITRRWQQLIGAQGMAEWKKSGERLFFHYAMNREMELSYSFIEDLAAQQTERLVITIPTLVYHGINDDTVPVDNSRQFAALNKDMVTLHELDDGHELTASTDVMWQGVERFLHISR